MFAETTSPFGSCIQKAAGEIHTRHWLPFSCGAVAIFARAHSHQIIAASDWRWIDRGRYRGVDRLRHVLA